MFRTQINVGCDIGRCMEVSPVAKRLQTARQTAAEAGWTTKPDPSDSRDPFFDFCPKHTRILWPRLDRQMMALVAYPLITQEQAEEIIKGWRE